jgi:hypothetical protein
VKQALAHSCAVLGFFSVCFTSQVFLIFTWW